MKSKTKCWLSSVYALEKILSMRLSYRKDEKYLVFAIKSSQNLPSI